MTAKHVNTGEVINLHTLKADVPSDVTVALMKTENMEVIRTVLPQGKKIPEHSVPGMISVQCLSGQTLFTVSDTTHKLCQGDWLYLEGNQRHSLEALTNSVLLVTILFE